MSIVLQETRMADIAGLTGLWSETRGVASVCIAVLDGPVDLDHPCFTGSDVTAPDGAANNIVGHPAAAKHGTQVASIIFGRHDGPVAGIAPGCRGLIFPIFKDGPNGQIAPCSQVDLAHAITRAVQHGANIINISGGELTPSDHAHPILADVIADCHKRDVLIVAAAGNQGCDCLHIPGAVSSVLAVGAMNMQGRPLAFSNWGEKYQMQGILAPGEEIPGAVPGGGVTTGSGTSYATAIVSGIVALIASRQRERRRNTGFHNIREAILNSAVGCDLQPEPDCRRVLAGRLNITGTLVHITKGGPQMSDSIEQKEARLSAAAEAVPDVPEAVVQPPPSEVRAAGNGSPEPSTAAPEIATPILPEASSESQVQPADCSCGGNQASPASPELVFAIGQLGFDFGSEARRDSILQHMQAGREGGFPVNPNDPLELLRYLAQNPWEAGALYWTLNYEATPFYAIQAHGPFADQMYLRLREFLCGQLGGEFGSGGVCRIPDGDSPLAIVERVSIAGYVSGSVRLLNGQTVPVIWPDMRCMYAWNTAGLIDAICGEPPGKAAKVKDRDQYTRHCEAVANFLERITHEVRNVGRDPRHRALNYAVTNALNVANIFEGALRDNMQLDGFDMEPSPICRPESECWDVILTFFDPDNRFNRARRVYRFAVDVSDVCPVAVGAVHSWTVF